MSSASGSPHSASAARRGPQRARRIAAARPCGPGRPPSRNSATSTVHSPSAYPPGPVTIRPGSPSARRARFTSTFRFAAGSAGRPVGPQRLGEHVVRHQVGAADGEHPQQRAHLAAAERRGRDLHRRRDGPGTARAAAGRTPRHARHRPRPPRSSARCLPGAGLASRGTLPALRRTSWAPPYEQHGLRQPRARPASSRTAGSTCSGSAARRSAGSPCSRAGAGRTTSSRSPAPNCARRRTSSTTSPARCGSAPATGQEFDAIPGQVTALPSGHDAWVVGDEPVVVVDWWGASNYAREIVSRVMRTTLDVRELYRSASAEFAARGARASATGGPRRPRVRAGTSAQLVRPRRRGGAVGTAAVRRRDHRGRRRPVRRRPARRRPGRRGRRGRGRRAGRRARPTAPWNGPCTCRSGTSPAGSTRCSWPPTTWSTPGTSARALGADETLDPEAVAAVRDWFESVEPLYREPGVIGPRVAIPDRRRSAGRAARDVREDAMSTGRLDAAVHDRFNAAFGAQGRRRDHGRDDPGLRLRGHRAAGRAPPRRRGRGARGVDGAVHRVARRAVHRRGGHSPPGPGGVSGGATTSAAATSAASTCSPSGTAWSPRSCPT